MITITSTKEFFTETEWDLIYNFVGHALDDDDYGWEVDSEVNWGIDQYFDKNITPKTGIRIIFDSPKYASRIFNFN